MRVELPGEFIEGAPRDGGAHILMLLRCLYSFDFESHDSI